jgi:uncharacterized membrane protein
MNDHEHPSDGPRPFWKNKAGVVLIMLLAIGLFYLVREHFGHISANWPYLILLACPLMHVFGHDHGRHGQHSESPNKPRDPQGR